ncbi:hypothetical protein B0H17DRAFT_1150009 [Mycena rosella]|uniref:CHAT domain-containing protein n=1 Tax=Mycena rosella TaxID=1033263 RepID=A0AAD7FPG4_MYCRO|nr:hypothetical protein B0H17DRAFT_1150009 [Mycena rosella]
MYKQAYHFKEQFDTGVHGALDLAISKFQEVVELSQGGHPRVVQALAGCFLDRYMRSGEIKDLDDALENFQAVLRKRYHELQEQEDLHAALENANEALDLILPEQQARVMVLKNLAILNPTEHQPIMEITIRLGQEALDLAPAGHQNRAENLHGLAVLLGDRFQEQGNLPDLESALKLNEEAAKLDPHNVDYLHDLTMTFRDQYQRHQDLSDLEAMLEWSQATLDVTPASHIRRPACLENRSAALIDRYQKLGDLNDLQEALKLDQAALVLTPDKHPARAGRLQSIASSYTLIYEKLRDLRDLEAAIQAPLEAIKITPTQHPGRGEFSHRLGICFTHRYHKLGDVKDLQDALLRDQESVQLGSKARTHEVQYLVSLSVSYRDRYERFKDSEDLESALDHEKKALALVQQDDFDGLGHCLRSLAGSFAHTYRSSGIPGDYDTAHGYYSRFFETYASNPELSWQTALEWASFAEQSKSLHWKDHCITAYTTAYMLLPEILWIGHAMPVRHSVLRRLNIGQTTATAVRICIDLGDSAKTLTKAVEIMEQGLATEFQRMLQLNTTVKGLLTCDADEFKKLSAELSSGTAINPLHTVIKRNQLLGKNPDTKDFLLPKSYDILCQASREGPVVTLNSHKDHCDGLSGEREQFISKTTEECFEDLLLWLEINIVAPIYRVLGSHEIHGGRLWWLPTGAFTGLPLHASCSTSQFIHSYTTTLGSLIESYNKKSSSTMPKLGIVGVTQTDSQGSHYLPQDSIEPSKSRLLLYEGNLELETILQSTALPNAELVFLAACQTAMGDAELVNESIHLSGGFIAAGFRSAIGTLWSMNNLDGPLVAKMVYSYLFRDGNQPQARESAKTLHLAVEELKARKYRDSIFWWVLRPAGKRTWLKNTVRYLDLKKGLGANG